MAHTPGPWKFVPDDGVNGPCISDEHGRTLADFYLPAVGDDDEVPVANARLASVSPKLLAACVAVVDACTSAPPVELVRRLDMAATLCATAVAEATGKAP